MNPLSEWFWPLVERRGDDECWLWVGYRDLHGYGATRHRLARAALGVGHVRAHRLAWTLTNGPIPEGLWVLHHCDNPPCCNPSHLWLGTNDDNSLDRHKKGRTAYGERASLAKLTAMQARQIRDEYASGGVSQRQLGRRYGVEQCAIRRIVDGSGWIEAIKDLERSVVAC